MPVKMPENPLGIFIKARRQQLGIASQRELATKAGISHGYIANLERGYDYATGKHVNPSVEKMEQIARALRVTPEQLGAIARGVDPASVLTGASAGDQATADQADAKQCKAPKPWSHHDLSQPTDSRTSQGHGLGPGNELSTLGREPSENTVTPDTVNVGRSEGRIIYASDLGPMRRLPVFRVSCGERVLLNDEPQDWQTWPISMTANTDGVLLVEGDSMLGAGIKPGDFLLFQVINGHRPQTGDTVIAEVDGGAVCKLYRRDESGEYLLSAPGDQDATPYFRHISPDVRLVGIVKRHVRNI